MNRNITIYCPMDTNLILDKSFYTDIDPVKGNRNNMVL